MRACVFPSGFSEKRSGVERECVVVWGNGKIGQNIEDEGIGFKVKVLALGTQIR